MKGLIIMSKLHTVPKSIIKQIEEREDKESAAIAYLLNRVSGRAFKEKDWNPSEHKLEIKEIQSILVNKFNIVFKEDLIQNIINLFEKTENNNSVEKIISEINDNSGIIKEISNAIFYSNYSPEQKFEKVIKLIPEVKSTSPELLDLRDKICSKGDKDKDTWYGFFNLGRVINNIAPGTQPYYWNFKQIKGMLCSEERGASGSGEHADHRKHLGNREESLPSRAAHRRDGHPEGSSGIRQRTGTL